MKRCPVCGLTSSQDVFCARDGARMVEAEVVSAARGVFVPAATASANPSPPATASAAPWGAGRFVPASPASPATAPTAVASGWQAAAPAAVAAVAAPAPVYPPLAPVSAAPAVAPLPATAPAAPAAPAAAVHATFTESGEDDTREPALQLVGSILDQRYRVDRELGAGGMGVVFKATHVLIDKPVAIKVLRAAHAKQADIAGRFSQEARIASKIKHPNVVEIVDYGATPMGCPYYVMEYLPGHSLAWEIDNVGRLSPARAIDVALQMTRGLAEAHRHGVVHRDLKPDNVFLIPAEEGRAEQVKILDFGIARVAGRKTRYTAAGSLVGTPEYMSPEQATGREVDHRTDLYAVGTLLFEMLTAKTPFRAHAIADVLAKQVYEAPPTLAETEAALPPLVHTERVIRRLLAKAPEERPGSADDVLRLLEQAAAADLGPVRAAGARDVEAPRPTVMLGSGSVSHEPTLGAALTPARAVGPQLAAPAAPMGFFAPGAAPGHTPPASLGAWSAGSTPAVSPPAPVAPVAGALTPVASPGHPAAAGAPAPAAPALGGRVDLGATPQGMAQGTAQGMASPGVATPSSGPSPAVGAVGRGALTAAPRPVPRGGPSLGVVLLLGLGAAIFAAFATLGVVSYLQRAPQPVAGDGLGEGHAGPAGPASPAGPVGPVGPAGPTGMDLQAGPVAADGADPAGPREEVKPSVVGGVSPPVADGASAAVEQPTPNAGQTTPSASTLPSNKNTTTGSKGSKTSSSASKKSSTSTTSGDPPAPAPEPAPEPAPKPKPKPVPDPNDKPIVDYGDLKDPFGDP